MLSPRERGGGEVARFYTVTEPKRHPRGYTLYKVTARVSLPCGGRAEEEEEEERLAGGGKKEAAAAPPPPPLGPSAPIRGRHLPDCLGGGGCIVLFSSPFLSFWNCCARPSRDT